MSGAIYTAEMSSPIGPLTVTATKRGICHIDFGSYAEVKSNLLAWSERQPELADYHGEWRMASDFPPLASALTQLERYFQGELQQFDLELDMLGTPFQRKVWEALQHVPYGETCSYKQIAEAIGQPAAVRAVGGANNRNPVAIIVPCHRVIGANGAMVGYGGGLPIKTALLRLETRD
ncbi:MAG: methylated-DNA--[protein]-cysteine S-methyltransferase [Candidatus Pristimantibacillus sp.]